MAVVGVKVLKIYVCLAKLTEIDVIGSVYWSAQLGRVVLYHVIVNRFAIQDKFSDRG